MWHIMIDNDFPEIYKGRCLPRDFYLIRDNLILVYRIRTNTSLSNI